MITKRFCLIKVTTLLILLLFGSICYGQDKKTILIFGDSITAGFGLDQQQAFPALIQQKIDSLGLNYQVVNAGLSGETTAGGVRRIDWILQQPVEIFILELGGNDGLRGLDPEDTKRNLQLIIDKVKNTYPEAKILLTGMEAPPNMGQLYTDKFRSVFHELHSENDVWFMPFILESVAGITDLNQADGIHPTAEGHQRVANDLWQYLEPILTEE